MQQHRNSNNNDQKSFGVISDSISSRDGCEWVPEKTRISEQLRICVWVLVCFRFNLGLFDSSWLIGLEWARWNTHIPCTFRFSHEVLENLRWRGEGTECYCYFTVLYSTVLYTLVFSHLSVCDETSSPPNRQAPEFPNCNLYLFCPQSIFLLPTRFPCGYRGQNTLAYIHISRYNVPFESRWRVESVETTKQQPAR